MKTYEDFRAEFMERDFETPVSHAQIEVLAAKEYAKQWIEEAAMIASEHAAYGEPVCDPILKLINQIDAQ